MHQNNFPQKTQLFDLLLHYWVHFHPNPHQNWLKHKSVLVCDDSRQLVHQNHRQQNDQFLMLFLITVATSIQTQFSGAYIFRDQACSFLGGIHFLNIALLRGTSPDIQLNQLFLKVFLLEARQWVHLERYVYVFSRDNNSMNIFPIGWYLTILGLHA